MKAMVLAAGKGTRLRPLTDVLPKPAVPVAGKPIIEHIFELLAESGFDEVHVNVCHLADVLLDLYGGGASFGGMAVHLTREEELLGTAGSVKRMASAAARSFDSTFVVVMGDALTDVDLGEVVAFHKERGALATMALMRVEDTSQYGVVELDPRGNIVGFQEKPCPEDAVSNLANTGVYVLEPEALDYIPEGAFYDFANDVFPRLLTAGERLVGYEGDFYWSDIGTLAAYRQAQLDALSGRVRVGIPGERRDGDLWVDRRARLHPDAVLEGKAVVGADAVVGSGAVLAGDVSVGAGCRVRPGAVVKRSILLPGAYVGEGARVEDSIVGPECAVRPEEVVRGEALTRERQRDRRRHEEAERPSPWAAGDSAA